MKPEARKSVLNTMAEVFSDTNRCPIGMVLGYVSDTVRLVEMVELMPGNYETLSNLLYLTKGLREFCANEEACRQHCEYNEIVKRILKDVLAEAEKLMKQWPEDLKRLRAGGF